MRGVQAKMMRDNLVSTPGICSYKIAGKYTVEEIWEFLQCGLVDPGGPYA